MDNYRELKIRCDPGFGQLRMILGITPSKYFWKSVMLLTSNAIIFSVRMLFLFNMIYECLLSTRKGTFPSWVTLSSHSNLRYARDRSLPLESYGFSGVPWTLLLVLINPFCVELRIKLAAKIWTIIENSKFAVTQVSDTYYLLHLLIIYYVPTGGNAPRCFMCGWNIHLCSRSPTIIISPLLSAQNNP